MHGDLLLGALPTGDGVRFRVPATAARELTLAVHDGAAKGHHRMQQNGDGTFELLVRGAAAGDRYAYSLEGAPLLPDPCSRFQPEGVHGPSEVTAPGAFPWQDASWRGCPSTGLIVYELHIGTFSPEGTFAGAAARLPLLRDLGVTAIEIMPVADFAGCRNWGYDGVCLFAPSRAYGRPDDLRALVDQAHLHGIAVLLDVVYNHLGPEGAYLPRFIPEYLTDRHETPWGRAVNVHGPGSEIVRRFILDNASHWVREYHLDGLRLDATHAIIDESPSHLVREIAAASRAAAVWPVHVHAEDHRNLATMVEDVSRGGWGLDAVWADDLHHAIRRHVAGDSQGYYADFTGSAEELARTMRQGWLYMGQQSPRLQEPRGTDPSRIAMKRFIVCLQNHDQVGNRAKGDRLHHGVDAARWRTASALLLMLPTTPLLFMGQEWSASTPFQFFTDLEPGLGVHVTDGRRMEFSEFPEFANADARKEIPDPQAAATFDASRLRWDERASPEHAAVLALYSELIALRRREPALAASDEVAGDAVAGDEDTVIVRRSGGSSTFWIVARLTTGGRVRVPAFPGDPSDATVPGSVVLTTEDSRFAVDPRRAAIRIAADGTMIEFARPGAVILKA